MPRPRARNGRTRFAHRPGLIARGLKRLLDLDRSALLLESGLHLGGIFLRHTLLHRLRGAIDQILRLLETEAGQLAHDLDDLDLLVAGRYENDVELRLLLDRRGRAARTATHRH